MKKVISFLAMTVIFFSFSKAQNDSNPKLAFDSNGKLKILQFTDIHFKYNSYRSDSALMLMKTAVEEEKPDLVVLTGDVVCSKNTKKAWLALAKPFIDAKVPWAVTLGNHDIEYELTSDEIIETISELPYNLTQKGPKEISGSGNYILEVNGSKSKDTKAILYFFDSHSGLPKEKGLGSYDWIKSDQIEWYRNQSKKLTGENKGTPYPALAFFHIPLPEYNEVWGKEKTVGVKEEKVCSPDINSGMYNAFLESGDVMGMFVGHDHVNNYIGTLRNIAMVYGQATGRETYGDIGKGYRVIELHEGQRKFDTWVRIKYNADRDKDIWEPTKIAEKQNFVTFPDSFAETK
ncbi:metallophosphoesterase family protein [Maribellus maritimus]|uniref:metallophosphoesterase family protein n=1 Tax=Maribellus maritimus TaxID=2870838 RepID=UPI001EEAF72D|nr:metallophosphoesterase family protein [Maribellus maritimus]MCG6188715.1 metallophosphoesterase family protein [Maribellus maritimus]